MRGVVKFFLTAFPFGNIVVVSFFVLGCFFFIFFFFPLNLFEELAIINNNAFLKQFARVK